MRQERKLNNSHMRRSKATDPLYLCIGHRLLAGKEDGGKVDFVFFRILLHFHLVNHLSRFRVIHFDHVIPVFKPRLEQL